jgi:hypothetical protein
MMTFRHHHRVSFLGLIVALALLAAIVIPTAAPVFADPATPYRVDMINGDFEEASVRTSLSSWVANGWEPFFEDWGATIMREPEFGVLYNRDHQAYNGAGCQRWFTTWATHRCGILQRVIVPANSDLTFSIWAISWSANNTDVYGHSDSGYSKWVGIDPYGGHDFRSPNIVWSQVNNVMDQYVQLTVSAKAVGNIATVFMKGEALASVKHNTCIVDEARLFSSAPMPGATKQPISMPNSAAPGLVGGSVLVPETGHSISGEWLSWFNASGFIDNNGLPVSDVIRDPQTGQWVQYFQRVILEYHPENPAPFHILRRLLGDVLYPGADAPLASPPANSADYNFFPTTTDAAKPTGLGHDVSNVASDGTVIGFKKYFDAQGGVNAFGYPKEEAKFVDGWWTQRFQAAVFQYHPENDKDGNVPGTNNPYRAYTVQPLLLGSMYVDKYGVQLP